MKRLLSSGNLVLTALLLWFLFIMVNFVSSRRYTRWDCTKQKITRLSDRTVQALRSLEEPLSVIVFYQPTHRLYGLVKDLLQEYARFGPRLSVEFVDPEQDIARAKQLASELKIEDLNVVVFRSGERHQYLTDTELGDFDLSAMQFGGEPTLIAFKGEEAFTSAIIGVTQSESPQVWFVGGHGEKSLDSDEPLGIANLKRSLEQQNMAAQAVTLVERTVIPAEVKLVVVPGPARRFTDGEVVLLRTYLDQGGRVLLLLDPLTDPGLDSLLSAWGIIAGNDIVVDPARQLPFVSAANVLVTDYTQHPIVEKMKMLVTLYPLARSVRPAEPRPEGIKVTALAFTSEAGWGETQTSVEQFAFTEGQDLKGPVPIAVAAERLPIEAQVQPPTEAGTPPTGGVAEGSAEGRSPRPLGRLVVIGDSEFAANSQLDNVGNKDLLQAAMYWLIAREQFIGIGPKPIETIRLNLTAAQLTRIFWFSFLAMPLACSVLGLGMWWLRRT